MTEPKTPVHVLCTSRESESAWLQRAKLFAEVDIRTMFPVLSGMAALHNLANETNQPFVVCRDDVWFGRGIGAQIQCLVEELDATFPNWAVCGNRGMRWDGRHVYDFTYDFKSLGLQTAVCAHPVISIDDNLVLVNPRRLRTHASPAPELETRRIGTLLSLECLGNTSVMAVSPRLMAMRDGSQLEATEIGLEREQLFGDYYRSSFLNHSFIGTDSALNMSEAIDYACVSEPWSATRQRDILDLYDQALLDASAGRAPSLTICCRTQFRRPELLERAVMSFSVFRQYSSLAEVHVRLLTDCDASVAEARVDLLQKRYPGAGLDCWRHDIRPNRFSRTDLLLAGIEKAETDYIWFVDDDDFVNGPTADGVGRCLRPGFPMVVIGSSAVLKEKWQPIADNGRDEGTRMQLVSAERASRYSASDVVRVLQGSNYIPICSMILPVETMRKRLRSVRALGDFNEDYFVLLTALTSSRVEVCALDVEIASISLRGEENTVALQNPQQWYMSYSTFMLEVLNNQEGNSPYLWQLGNSMQR